MAGRSGPISTLGGIAFALPFVGAGGMSAWLGLKLLAAGQSSGLAPLAFGGLFVGVGAWQIRSAVRGRRSAEERAQRVRSHDAMPIVGAPPAASGYRIAAGAEPSARDVYGALLEAAPLPKLDSRGARTLAWSLGLQQKTIASDLAATLIVNGLAWTFFIIALRNDSGWADLGSLVFVGFGLMLIVHTVRRWLGRRKLARVEIDSEPVYLGSNARLYIEQAGPAKIIRYRVNLRCREHVTYTVGTDTRTETNDVLDRELIDELAFKVGIGERWSRTLELELPPQPASFHADHNRVEWTIRIRAEIDGWPDYDESFAFRALPKVAP